MTTKTNTPKTKAPQQAKQSVVVVEAAAEKAPKTVTVVAAKERVAKKVKPTNSKSKIVRDKFSMPQSDYAKIEELKQLCLKSGLQVKKSQLLRAGLQALQKMNASQLKAALSSLD